MTGCGPVACREVAIALFSIGLLWLLALFVVLQVSNQSANVADEVQAATIDALLLLYSVVMLRVGMSDRGIAYLCAQKPV